MITLSNVSKTFSTPQGSLRAVAEVSLHVAAGDVLGIVGFSGAGKSTLLRMINLLERPDQGGKVIVAGENLAALKPVALNAARHAIGMIFQNFNLLSNRTVFDNVSLPLEIAAYPASRRRARVLECLDIVGLADKAASYPAKLSGGQKQRVAIARALANGPQVLLCDEPTSSLDPQTTDTILVFLRRINEQFGTTIVVVTHEMHVVRSICNTVGVMEQGRLVERFAMNAPGFQPQSLSGQWLLQTQALPAQAMVLQAAG